MDKGFLADSQGIVAFGDGPVGGVGVRPAGIFSISRTAENRSFSATVAHTRRLTEQLDRFSTPRMSELLTTFTLPNRPLQMRERWYLAFYGRNQMDAGLRPESIKQWQMQKHLPLFYANMKNQISHLRLH